VFALMK